MAVKLNKGSALDALNLTPLIDVVFLLLIFFLVASRFEEEERELSVALPAASEAQPLTAKPKETFVNINAQGEYIVQNQSLSAGQLQQALTDLSNADPGRVNVIIRADKACPWQFVVSVMNMCNKAKITNYTVAADHNGDS